MNKPDESLKNPYRVPTSDLEEGLSVTDGWSSSAVRLALKYFRNVYLNVIFAMCFSSFALIVVDATLHRENGVIHYLIGGAIFGLLLSFIFVIPCGTLYILIEKRRYPFSKYVTKRQKELSGWYSKPLVLTISIAIGSSLVILYDIFTREPVEFSTSYVMTIGKALIALPFVMPMVYIWMKSVYRRSKNLVELMSRET